MLGLIVRRLIAIIPILLIVSFGVFMLTELVPGDPAVTLAGGINGATPERIAEIREILELDKPLLQRYGIWLTNAIQLDFGKSLYSPTNGPTVVQEIWTRLPVTLSIVAAGVFFASLIGVPLGVLAGIRPGSVLDRTTSTSIMIGLAIPNFLLALALIWVLAIWLRWFPALGFTPLTESPIEWFKSILLPGLALGMAGAASLGRQVRAALVDVLYSNYVRTAWAKGCSPYRAVGKHALKNAAIPGVTVLGLQISALLGGAVLVEQIFSLPGIGTMMLRALTNSDVPIIQGVVVFFVLVHVFVNLLVDISYGLLNPKVRVT
jgi:peptide/nickel transport system permease protein